MNDLFSGIYRLFVILFIIVAAVVFDFLHRTFQKEKRMVTLIPKSKVICIIIILAA